MTLKTKAKRNSSLLSPVQSAAKVLDYLSTHGESGVRELSKDLGLTKSTAHRLLATLESVRYVEQDPKSEKYRLAIKLLELGSSVIRRLRVTDEARPFLQDLAKMTGETAHLAILDRGEMVFIDKFDSTEALQMVSHVGQRNPVHCSANGKVVLAHLTTEERTRILEEMGLEQRTNNTITSIDEFNKHLDIVRQQGFAIDYEEYYDNISSVAAPIRDHTRKVVAGISITGPSVRMTPQRLRELCPMVCQAANQISFRLGYTSTTTTNL